MPEDIANQTVLKPEEDVICACLPSGHKQLESIEKRDYSLCLTFLKGNDSELYTICILAVEIISELGKRKASVHSSGRGSNRGSRHSSAPPKKKRK